MDWIPVKSSNLKEIAYDPDERILGVRFLNGTEYEYKNIPPQIFEGLKNADSKGTYLARYVKGIYLYKRVR